MRRFFQLALALSILLHTAGVWAATPDPQTTYYLATERVPLTLLDGQWRFQPGDDPQWASPDLNDEKWALVSSGADWDEVGYHHLDGVAWYRFHVMLPVGDSRYSLYLPVIYTSYQVFVNGRLMMTQGKLPPHPRTFVARPVVLDLPDTGPRSDPQELTIALRIWHDPFWSLYQHGGLHGIAEVGRSDLIHDRFDVKEEAHLWQYSDDINLGLLELLAAAVALVLFFTRRSEREFLWFALLMFASGANHEVNAWMHLHAVYLLFSDLLAATLQVLFPVAALIFFHALFGSGKWTNAFVFALACCGLGAMVYPLSWTGAITIAQTNFAEIILSLPAFVVILYLIRQRAKQKDLDARILRGPTAFLCFALVYSNLIWALETSGMVWFSTLTIRWKNPVYFTLTDIAEVIFLTAMLTILLRRFTLRSREQDRVHSEIEAARSVQQVLVPETLPSITGLSIDTAYHPAQEVGGDFFQILPMPDGTTLIVIGDVAGKGLPAALQVSLAVGTLRALIERTTSPAELLSGLNRSLQGRGPGFTTCLALCISSDRTVLTFANAGHIAPFVNGFELRTEPNLPLGLVPEIDFDEVHYTLQPGDHIAVLTDGVPEAMHHRELFGFERTGQVSRQTADAIADAALQFGQTDDITVLTIDVIPVVQVEQAPFEPAWQPA